jgi:hypothetical protein
MPRAFGLSLLNLAAPPPALNLFACVRHASIQTTLNTYSGGMMDSMREAHGRVVNQAMAR